jgi:hypothetical protein
MNDYDEIYKFNGWEYDPFEIFDNLWLIIFYDNQNIR